MEKITMELYLDGQIDPIPVREALETSVVSSIRRIPGWSIHLHSDKLGLIARDPNGHEVHLRIEEVVTDGVG